jgi:hypothetical protein
MSEGESDRMEKTILSFKTLSFYHRLYSIINKAA